LVILEFYPAGHFDRVSGREGQWELEEPRSFPATVFASRVRFQIGREPFFAYLAPTALPVV
jgi:hypothetical protein